MGERFSSGLGGRRKRPGILFQSRWPSISRTTGPCGGGRLDGGEPAGGVFPGEVLRPPGGSRRPPPPVRPPPDHPRAPAVAPRPSVRPPTGSAASTRGTLGMSSLFCKTARLGRAPRGLRPRSVRGVPAVFGGMGPHLYSLVQTHHTLAKTKAHAQCKHTHPATARCAKGGCLPFNGPRLFIGGGS